MYAAKKGNVTERSPAMSLRITMGWKGGTRSIFSPSGEKVYAAKGVKISCHNHRSTLRLSDGRVQLTEFPPSFASVCTATLRGDKFS